MQCRSLFQWVRVDVWELGRDIIIKHQKSEQCSVPEAAKQVVWELKWLNMFLDRVPLHQKIWNLEWFL